MSFALLHTPVTASHDAATRNTFLPMAAAKPVPNKTIAKPDDEVSGAMNLSIAMSGLFTAPERHERLHKAAAKTIAPSAPATASGAGAGAGKLGLGAVTRSTIVKNGMALPSTLQRIALLEDCQIEADGLSRLFQENGYKVVSYSSGFEFLKMLESESFDLMILDWNVPDITGIEVLHAVRNVNQLTTPVLMLTSRASEYDVVQALNRGADDYLQKPWQPFEIVARVNALLRRQRYAQSMQDERYSDFILDTKQQQITHKGKVVKLSNKEFLLAQLLLRHMGSPVSRAHISQTVWNDTPIEARTLDVHVSRLRQKLSLTAEEGFSLISVYGYGYRLEKLVNNDK